MIKNIEKYIDRCDIYQKMKNCMEVLVKKLMVNKMSKKLLWLILQGYNMDLGQG